MIDLRPFLTASFWFNLNPLPPSMAVALMAFGLFALMIVVGLGLMLARRRVADKLKRSVLSRVASLLMWMGVVAALFFFCYFEQVSFLGARFWFLLWFIGLIVWIVAILRFVRRDVPRMRENNKRQKERSKYLPK